MSKKPKKEDAPAQVEVSAAKGRPMLSWVGKKPLRYVPALPAQHVETYDPSGDLAKIKPRTTWLDWPGAYPKTGLLFHGDNKEVLAHLLANGFRGRVNLIYIDPPFDSGADYVRKVELRGVKGQARIEGEEYTLGEQIQYTDIWANDNYLQFMYERLLLSKELLAESGIFVLHCDWRKEHHLRVVLDEVFGANSFRNEIYWYFYNKMHDVRKGILPRATNTLLVYAKGDEATFHRLAAPRESVIKQLKRVKVDGILVNLKDEDGNLVYQESDAKTLDNIWGIPLIPPADKNQKTDYPTQKPEALLELLLLVYTNPGDIITDYCVGSGTTAAVAQRLGRRWIGCDINKGAIHTTAKRLQNAISEQIAECGGAKQGSLMDDTEEKPPEPTQSSFCVFRVNDYDLQVQHNEAIKLACEYIGVETSRSDAYFEGVLGKSLVKIIPFNHPLSPMDLEDLKRELEARKDEDREVVLVCLGMELTAHSWVEEWNRVRKKGHNVPNRLRVIELRTDPKYAGFIKHDPASARVKITRSKGRITVRIEDFVSPTIIKRLDMERDLFQKKIKDWRCMVDCVMIDPAYDGKVFNVALSDIPSRKNDLVSGEYDIPAPDGGGKSTVAVKIIDMLGEEVLVTKEA